jgi:4,5-DOPA dioxygenase extradiol
MVMAPQVASKALAADRKSALMPVLFIGHGSPMNAIEDSEFSRAWRDVARHIPRPAAILSISAHWQSDGARVTAMKQPRTIHDFSGFPDELNNMSYPASGSPDLARKVRELPGIGPIEPDQDWGLDHGTWAVLCRMYPEADIPVVQLSLDHNRTPDDHYKLGRLLRPLREQGVLILGSGNMVHNLGMMGWTEMAFDWAARFDLKLKSLIEEREDESLVNYADLGPDARLAIPTNEHYLPMLYALASTSKDEPVRFFAEKVTLGSISMRCFQIG